MVKFVIYLGKYYVYYAECSLNFESICLRSFPSLLASNL